MATVAARRAAAVVGYFVADAAGKNSFRCFIQLLQIEMYFNIYNMLKTNRDLELYRSMHFHFPYSLYTDLEKLHIRTVSLCRTS